MNGNYTNDKNKREGYYMGEKDLLKYIAELTTYVAKIKETETKEESREALIRTGVLDSNGNIRKELQHVFQ